MNVKMILTRAVTIVVIVFVGNTAAAQKGRAKYEFMRSLPVYADSLIADLTECRSR